jgi:hypothetical protein
MGSLIEQQANIKQTRNMIFDQITRCIADIQNTVASSGLKMRDVNVGIEIYQTTSGSYIVELKLG